MSKLRRTTAAPSKQLTLEEHLAELVQRGLLNRDQRHGILQSYYNELQSRTAQAVRHALLKHDRDLESKDAEIRKLAHLLEEKAHGSTKDKNTGLLTGLYFDDLLPKLINGLCVAREHHDRRSGCPCLVVGDVRSLKLYNDTWGHAVGDALMHAVGATILQNLRSGESWACRSNTQGDEVEIFMLGARDPIEAGHAAARLKDAFCHRRDWAEFDPAQRLDSIPPNVDFGAVAIKGSSLRGILENLSQEKRAKKIANLVHEWRKKADEFMYEAKQQRLEHIAFGWFEYRDGELVDITSQMAQLKLRHGVK